MKPPLCACGCERPVNLPDTRHRNRMPTYLRGHHSRHNEWAYKSPPDAPTGICECGCGGPTPICTFPRPDRRQYTGHPLPLIPGHRRPEPTDRIRKLTDREAAYLAGIIDGEGCIHFLKDNGRSVRVTVVNTSALLIDWLRGVGGHVTVNRHRFSEKRKSQKRVHAWTVGSWRTVHDVLEQVAPFMIIKRAKAEHAIANLKIWLTQSRTPRKTQCIRGHVFTPQSTAFAKRDGAQICRVCCRDRARRSREGRRLATA